MGADVDQIHEPDAVITAQERQEAEQTAELIRQGLEGIEPLVQRAWQGRHWVKLGYPDWAAYVTGEFGEHRIQARRAVAALLSGEGYSDAQIARETGVPRSTVQRDLGREGAHSRAPQPDQAKRNADVTRKLVREKRPKTGAQRVQEHRARKRTGQAAHDPDCGCATCAAARPDGYRPPIPGQETTPASSSSSPVQESVQTGTAATATAAEPQPCPGCRNLEAKLAVAEERIGKLKAALPDVVLTAERDFLAGRVAELEARITELEAETGGTGETGPCVHCGRPGPLFLYDGEETGKHACDRCFRKAAAKDELLSRRAEKVSA